MGSRQEAVTAEHARFFEALDAAFEIVKDWHGQDASCLEALDAAVEVIKGWHGQDAWDLYWARAPEMKLIREFYERKESK